MADVFVPKDGDTDDVKEALDQAHKEVKVLNYLPLNVRIVCANDIFWLHRICIYISNISALFRMKFR